MKLNKNKTIVKNSDFELEGIDASIDSSSMAKMWDVLSNPYKDSISSIVREITSNCFDSHKKANVNDPVVITLDKDNSGTFITFSDVGTGLSPDDIKNIYIKYLTSTKENSNSFIGAFGIGSKSPLSYTDIFYIDTIYEGIKYQYMMRKGEQRPRIEKLIETSINERNGTQIKIYIKEGVANTDNYHLGDLGSFIKGIEHQLKYFDDVYVNLGKGLEHLSSVLSPIINNLNNFKIFKSDNWIYRADKFTINDNANLELCLGTVYYPIDWKIVFPELDKPIKLPVALKFDIGELDVIYTREDVRYTESSIRAIRNKTSIVVKEIVGKINDSLLKNKWQYSINELYQGYDDVFKNNYKNYGVLKLNDEYNLNVKSFIYNYYILTNVVNFSRYGHDIHAIFRNFTSIVSEKYNDTKSPEFKLEPNDLGKYIPTSDIELLYKIPQCKEFNNTKHIDNLNYIVFGSNSTYNYPLKFKCHTNFKINYKKLNSNIWKSKFTRHEIKSKYISDVFHHIYDLKTDSTNPIVVYKYKYIINDVKPSIKIKRYLNEKANGVQIISGIVDRSLTVYKTILNLRIHNKSKWRDMIKEYQKLVEDPLIKTLVKISDIEKLATDKWYDEWKKKNLNKNKIDISEFNYKALKLNFNSTPSIFQGLDINDFYSTSYDVSNISSMNSSNNFKHDDPKIKNGTVRKIIVNNNQKSEALSLLKIHAIIYLLKYKKEINNSLKLDNYYNYGLMNVSLSNYNKLKKEKLMYTIQDYVKDNEEVLIDLYCYIHYYNEINDKLKLSINNKNINDYWVGDKLKSIINFYKYANKKVYDEIKKRDNIIDNIIAEKNKYQNLKSSFEKINLNLENLLSLNSSEIKKKGAKKADIIKKEISDYINYKLKYRSIYSDIYSLGATERIYHYSNTGFNGTDLVFNDLSHDQQVNMSIIQRLIDDNQISKDSIFNKFYKYCCDNEKDKIKILDKQRFLSHLNNYSSKNNIPEIYGNNHIVLYKNKYNSDTNLRQLLYIYIKYVIGNEVS